MAKKSIDRHVDPEMVVYPVRMELRHLEFIRNIAKKEDRTRQSLVREALQRWMEWRIKR
jgi:hypothetical protein